MRFDTDAAFRHDATAWLQSLTDEIVADLQAVFRRSPGYYPTTLVELWRGEVERRGLIDVELSGLTSNGATRLPVCHPGDYEWRFTAETATTLLDQAASGLPRGAVVAHLGTPTTFVLGRERHSAFRHMLLDRSQSVVDALGAVADVYRIDFTSDASPRPARVRYQMPHFEAASLEVAAPGLLVPSDWRVGDVLTLEKISDATSRLPQVIPAESWHDVVFGPVRIKLRRTQPPNLGSLVPGDILDTVSRRDPIRKRIGLWTSGNRVFTLEDPAANRQTNRAVSHRCHAVAVHARSDA